jgi:hypothetical protein
MKGHDPSLDAAFRDAGLLTRDRATLPQVDLPVEARARNVRAADQTDAY